jgi:Rieske Fe-S protein
MNIQQETSVTRRAVLAGAAVGVTTALAACGDSSPSGSGSGSGTGSGSATVSAAEVPVGGGKILTDQSVVVTQPTAGTYKAFSAVCTHQGCVVSSVANSRISCACHNSQFSAADGSVITGPATRALTAKSVSVSGDTLTVS